MFSTVMSFADALDKIHNVPQDSLEEIKHFLLSWDEEEMGYLFSFADKVREKSLGSGILLRGIVEFSNYCGNSCFYCGLNKNNSSLRRYRMSAEEIFGAVSVLNSMNIKTVVLQSGEDAGLDPFWLAEVIKEIKTRFGLAVTLSVGERAFHEYRLWRKSGSDRYLLKIETTDRAVYSQAHSSRNLETRLRCLDDLFSLGYQVGSGILVGLRGQSIDSLARDILFLREKEFDMIGIGPFIPHPETVFANDTAGDVRLTLKVLALTRIVTKDAHMPATTALGSAGEDYRIAGLKCGANVLMPNFTPERYRGLYEIYPGKACLSESSEKCVSCMDAKAHAAGRVLDYSIGHSLKKRYNFS